VPDPRRVQLLIVVAAAATAGTLAGAVFAPPDPYTHLAALGVAVVLALPVAYLVAYRTDWLAPD
jgi:hypothetical protein